MSDLKSNLYIQQKNELDYLMKVIDAAPSGRTLGILLQGPPGTGKTLLAITLAKMKGSNYYIIDGSPQLDRRDIEGNWEIMKGDTIFNEGPLVLGLKDANSCKVKMAFIIINEINAIRPSEQISMNSLLSESHINLINKASERVELAEDAKVIVIGTMNRNVLGINSLQEAFNDRFFLNLTIEYPEKAKEAEIVSKISKCSLKLADLIIEAGQHLRKMAENGSVSKIFSTRMGVNFASVLTSMGASYVEENIKSMIVTKLSDEADEEESIKQMLSGLKFESRLKEILTVAKPTETPAPSSVPTESVLEDMRKVVEEYFPMGKIFKAGKLTYSFLEWSWANHKDIVQKYFELTKEMGLFEEYEKETSKTVHYGGALTFTYINWIYQHRHHKLIDFMAKRYSVLGKVL